MVHINQQRDQHAALEGWANLEALSVNTRLDVADEPELDRHLSTTSLQRTTIAEWRS
jgi:hypothetical protein